MKKILSLLLLLPAFAFAQDTCQVSRQTDAFTHQVKVSTGFVPFVVSGHQVNISVDATDKEIDFFFWFQNDGSCFDTESSAQINYEGDRLKANFKNSGSMNCEGAFHFSFRNTPGTPSNLQRLTDRNISSIKFTGSNKTVIDLAFTAEQKLQLRRMAACVVREAKTLLK